MHHPAAPASPLPPRLRRPASPAATARRAVNGSRYAETGGVAELVVSGDPEPAALCANLARCIVEILAGARPLDQIGRWVSDSVYVHLLRRTVLSQRARATTTDVAAPRPRMTIGEPLLASPSQDVVEAVVMVHQPSRSRAVAIRLERHRARWRATAINVL